MLLPREKLGPSHDQGRAEPHARISRIHQYPLSTEYNDLQQPELLMIITTPDHGKYTHPITLGGVTLTGHASCALSMYPHVLKACGRRDDNGLGRHPPAKTDTTGSVRLARHKESLSYNT